MLFWMSSAKEQAPTKYSYRHRYEPDAPKKQEPEDVNRKELQDYIDRLLGVQSRKTLDSADKVV
jgi:hypothetical protein